MRRVWLVLASLVAGITVGVTPAHAYVICPVGIYNMELSAPLYHPFLGPGASDVTASMDLGDCDIDFLFETAWCNYGSGKVWVDTGFYRAPGVFEWAGPTMVISGLVWGAYVVVPNPLEGSCDTGLRHFVMNGSVAR